MPWHRECFVCTNCNKELAKEKFTSREDKPYCAECYGQLFAKKCCRCDSPISGTRKKVDKYFYFFIVVLYEILYREKSEMTNNYVHYFIKRPYCTCTSHVTVTCSSKNYIILIEIIRH